MTLWPDRLATPGGGRPRTYERRIGRRVQPDADIVLHWRPERRPGPAARLRGDEPQRARLVDVSVTGAQLLVPNDDRVQRGTVVEIGAGASWGSADVRWVAPVAGQRYTQCGVQFSELEEDLRNLLYSQTLEPDHTERIERWDHAR